MHAVRRTIILLGGPGLTVKPYRKWGRSQIVTTAQLTRLLAVLACRRVQPSNLVARIPMDMEERDAKRRAVLEMHPQGRDAESGRARS